MSIGLMALTIFLTGMLLYGDYLIKFATNSPNAMYLLVSAGIVWVASIPGWFFVVSQNRLAIVGMLFAILSLIGTTMIGMFCFREKLTVTEWISFALAIAASILLSKKA